MEVININKKLRLMLIIPIIFYFILFFIFSLFSYLNVYKIYKNEIKTIKEIYLKNTKYILKEKVDSMIDEMNFLYNHAKSENHSIDKIKKFLISRVSKSSNKSEYFFIDDFNGTIIFHINKKIIGKNFYNLKDKNGVYIKREIIKAAKKGGGFVKYYWENPQTKKIEPKLTYVKPFKKFHWIIGTGIYINELNEKIKEIDKLAQENIKKTFILATIVLLIITILTISIMYLTVKKIKLEIINIYNKLIYQTKKANQLSKVKSQFLANMSHEIRTPLNAIMGFLTILKENIKEKENHKYIQIIEDASNNLLEIINDILDFSKIESGKLSIEKIDFKPQKEFNNLVQLYKGKLKEKNLNLITKFENLPKALYSDPLRIKQVINNLLSNAIKFTPEGKKIYLTIKYTPNKLFVSVKDEGIGIKKEYLKDIFKPFTQEDFSTTRKYGGSGLGLAISYNLVKLLGGELKVKTEEGKGSEFYFEIPIKEGKIRENKKVLSKNKTFNAKVLIVEDNKSNQLFLTLLLKKLGIESDIANDGIEAIEKFENNKYDIIFMDENMPNMSGIETTKKILKIEKEKNLPHTPIIAITANALKGDKEKFLKVMDDYLAKPINKKNLLEILNKYL